METFTHLIFVKCLTWLQGGGALRHLELAPSIYTLIYYISNSSVFGDTLISYNLEWICRIWSLFFYITGMGDIQSQSFVRVISNGTNIIEMSQWNCCYIVFLLYPLVHQDICCNDQWWLNYSHPSNDSILVTFFSNVFEAKYIRPVWMNEFY